MSKTLKISTFIFSLMLIVALGLTACAQSGSASNKPVDVQITLTEFKIDSSQTTFKVGVPYHFVVKNDGSVAHEMYIMPPMSAGTTPEQAQQAALAGFAQEQLPAGTTATFDYTFTKAYPSGELEFACHLPGHYEGGMHTSIVVNQ